MGYHRNPVAIAWGVYKEQSKHDPQEELNIITLTNEQLALFFPITTRATLDF